MSSVSSAILATALDDYILSLFDPPLINQNSRKSRNRWPHVLLMMNAHGVHHLVFFILLSATVRRQSLSLRRIRYTFLNVSKKGVWVSTATKSLFKRILLK